MGKLEKFVKNLGAFGQKIVRGKNTFGRNMQREVDMNELIRTLDKTYVIEHEFGPFTQAEYQALNTTRQTIIPAIPGKIIVPVGLMFHMIKEGGTAETSNSTMMITWNQVAADPQGWWVGSKFMISVAKSVIFTENDSTVTAGLYAGSMPAIDDFNNLVGLGIEMKSTGAFNGDFSIGKSKIWYRIMDPIS
tara:strand:- start:770 stop:1342 length:573 start_codon:yes stop_codon:yes gene_type:complete